MVFDTLQINIDPQPIVDFTTTGVCVLNAIDFTNNSTILTGTITTYSWDFGDGIGTSALENPSYTYAAAGTYPIKLVVESDQGCTDSLTQFIIVNESNPVLTASQSICPNATATLVASGAINYTWKELDNLGNIVNNNLSNLATYTTATLSTTTTYRVVFDNGNCIDSLETTVSIFTPATLDAGNDQTICAGETANLSAQAGFTNYQWQNLTTGEFFVGQDIVVTIADTSEFALQANDSNGCLVNDTLQINVNPAPTADFTTTGNCVLNAIDFTNTSTISSGIITTYSWDFGDGVGMSSLENPSYTYTAAGTYSVKLVIESDQNCTDSITQSITVNTISPTLTANQSICPNETATLVATGANNYIWKELDNLGAIINNNLSTLSTYTTAALTTETTYRVIFDNERLYRFA